MIPAITGKSIEYVMRHKNEFKYVNVAALHKKYDALIIEDENEFKIELKTDSGRWKSSGNIVLETYKKKYQTKGWFNTTDADFICFCLTDKGNVRRMIIVPMTE
jgi:hypothetical protein